MMQKKKFLALACIITTVTVLSFGMIVCAEPNKGLTPEQRIEKSNLFSLEDKVKLKELIATYSVKLFNQEDIQIPEEVSPGETQSVKGIEVLLIHGRDIVKHGYTGDPQELKNVSSPIAEGVAYGSTYMGFNYYLHLDAHYTYLWSSSRQTNYVSSVNYCNSYLSGYHFLVGWTQTGAYGYPINDGFGIHAECTGTWDTYIFVPGVGVVLVGTSPGSWAWDQYFVP